MSCVLEWVAFLTVVGFGRFALTLALGIVHPTLTTRQRWAVVFWLAAATGFFLKAWQLS